MKISPLMQECPVSATLEIIGGKYKPLILWHLQDGTQRFSELQRLIPQATPKVLTQQLRELEADGAVERTVYPVVPPRVDYEITDFGRTLMPVLRVMCDWGTNYLAKQPDQSTRCNHTTPTAQT